eukprot:358170-Chlamydomonas_euryale.AAC.1
MASHVSNMEGRRGKGRGKRKGMAHLSHTEGCTTLATPDTASTRPRHSSNPLDFFQFQGSFIFLRALHQVCLSKARSAVVARISRPRNQFHAVNLRKSRKVGLPPEPSARHPWTAALYIPEKSPIFLRPCLNLSCSTWPSSATYLATEQSKTCRGKRSSSIRNMCTMH